MTTRSLAVIALLVTACTGTAHAQTRGVRFEVVAVGDTTVAFRSGAERWIRKGDRGIAVDPRRRDALVARLRVLRVEKGTTTAVVTGQTTAVNPEHVVVIQERRPPWWRRGGFWGGLVAGATIGTVVGSQR